MSNQRQLLKQMSDKEIIKALYMSQGLILIVCLLFYFVFIRDVSQLSSLWQFEWDDILFLGVCSPVVIVMIEIFIDKIVPEKWSDDGGINERMFQALSYPHIFILMAVVAFSEELLFRGMIQTQFGLIFASIIFALIHFRYLKKPLLLITAVILGFYLGWLFLYTGSLLVPAMAHYTIDVLLGIILKKQIKSKQGGVLNE